MVRSSSSIRPRTNEIIVEDLFDIVGKASRYRREFENKNKGFRIRPDKNLVLSLVVPAKEIVFFPVLAKTPLGSRTQGGCDFHFCLGQTRLSVVRALVQHIY